MAEVKKSKLQLHIIDCVKEMRVDNKMSQAVLAIKLGVSDSFIGAVENPKHRAKYNLEHLNELAKIFKCSPKDFLPENPI